MNLIFAVLTIYSALLVVRSGTWNESKWLMSDLMRQYDHRLRPINDQSKPIIVDFAFDLISIRDLNEVEGKVSAVGFMHLRWLDEKLTWNSSEYGDTRSLTFPVKDIWHPTIVLANSHRKISDIADEWMVVVVRSDGHAFYYPGDVFTASCLADVTYYPLDYQTCYLHFVSWGFSSGRVSFKISSHIVLKTYFTENGEWRLVGSFSYRLPGRHEYEVDSVGVAVILKRRSTFLIVNVILPVVFMSVINILVFLLPSESGERVSFALTVLLSLAVFLTLLVNNLPKTSKPIAILCYYLMLILVVSVVICVITITNLRIFYMDSSISVPRWCSRLCKAMRIRKRPFTVNGKPLPSSGLESDNNGNETHVPINTVGSSWRDVSRALDRLGFFFFLSALIVINGVYLSVLSKNHAEK